MNLIKGLVVILMLLAAPSSIANGTFLNNLYTKDLAHKEDWLEKKYDRARAFANRYAIYAVYSVNVYDKGTKDYPEIFLPTNEFNDEIFHPSENVEKTGFRGKAWLRYRYGLSQKHKPILVIAFRGTEDITDYLHANLVFYEGSGPNQFKSAKDYTNSVIKNIKMRGLEYSKIIFTGHSLGGGLAEYMQLITDNSEAVVFMPSPNNGFLYSLSSGDKRKNMNSTRIYEKGEILNVLRLLSSHDYTSDPWPDSHDEIKTAWIDFFKWSLTMDHSIRDFAMLLLRAADLEGNCSAKNILNNIKEKHMPTMKLDINESHQLACASGNNEVENQKYPLEKNN